MRILLPLYGFVLTAFAFAALFIFKSGLDEYVASRGLVATAVTTPEGWVVRAYETKDGELITEVSFDPDGPVDTTQSILAKYQTRAGDIQGSTLTTFARGDERVALRISTAPHTPPRASLAGRFGRAAADEVGDIDDDRVFATLAGLPVLEEPRFTQVKGGPPMPVNYRYFTITIGDRAVDEVLEVSILTNSSDAAVLAALNSLDVETLHAQLPTPDPRVILSAGVLTRDALPLSDARPLPSPAYRAKQLLDAGQVFDAPWHDALVQIRMGDIEHWDDLKTRYPRVDTTPLALLDVLHDGSHENAARHFATILSNSGRNWSGHEYHVLSMISAAGTTQADLTEYLSGEFDIAPEVLALAQRLPQAAPSQAIETQVVETGRVPTPGLRGNATWVIENGFRKCTVLSN